MGREKLNKAILLEEKVYRMACLVSMGASSLYFLVDLIFTKEYISLPVEFLSVIIFYFFLIRHHKTEDKQMLYFWFMTALLIFVDISWVIGGGYNVPNASILYLTGIVAVILSTKENRRKIVLLYLFNCFIICGIIFYFSDKSLTEKIAGILFIFITIIIGAILLIYIKQMYEREREIINDQLKLLDLKNNEIVTQNEELLQQHEEIISQRDYIEDNNRKLVEANEEIKTVNESLEEKVKERTAKLKNLYNDLDTLFYRSSHDFRRPLTSLMGLSQLAKMSLKDKDALEIFNQVDSTANNMDRMLIKFLMLYQINHYESFDIVEIKTLDKRVREKLIKNSVADFKLDVNTEKYKSHDHRNLLLKIILYNLVENSLMYSATKSLKIQCRIKEVESTLLMEVEDNGIGISPNLINKVFEIYFRGSLNSTGNGLGLYVAKKAVDKLEGDIQVISVPNEKTCFTITFPI